MDRYLFENFVFRFDDEMYNDTCRIFAQQAKNIVKKSGCEKVTFNYYPQNSSRFQFVVEGTLDNSTASLTGLKIHHASEDVWKMKIVNVIDGCEGSYLITRPDGNGLAAVRFVNEQVLDTLTEDSLVDAQMVAFALDISIFEDENAYHQSKNDGLLMNDGLVVATDYIVNNSTKLTDEERKSKDHSLDNLVDICGTITKCYKCPLKMFDMDLDNYYIANIMTDFGQIKIIIPRLLFPENVKGFQEGNIIVAKAMLSGDVCIYDFDQYATFLNKNYN